MDYPKVIYLEGTPFVGKTTTAQHLSCRLKYSVSPTDDIGAAITAVTTKHTHEEFHYMEDCGFPEYYVLSDKKKLISDINLQHKALWPALEVLFHNHLSLGSPAIFEGWALRPEYVSRFCGDIAGAFLLAEDDLIEDRVRSSGFGAGATDHQKAVDKYLARSVCYNNFLKKAVTSLGLRAVWVSAGMPPVAVADECLRVLGEE